MIIDFTPDGQVQAMHRDEFDLGFLGPKHVERASEIKFNDLPQRWEIQLPVYGNMVGSEDHSLIGWQCPFDDAAGFYTYDGARKIEVLWFDKARLEGVDPGSTEGLVILKFIRGVNPPDL